MRTVSEKLYPDYATIKCPMKSIILFVLFVSLVSTLPAGNLKGKVKERTDGIVVAVRGIKGEFQPPQKHAIISQKDMLFIPRVLPILVGTTVDFPNDELVIYHNVFSVSPENRFDLGTYRTGVTKSVTFKDTSIVEVLCNIHVRMYAAIIVLDNPYFTCVQTDGSYEIKNVPAGEYSVEIYLVKNQKVIRRQSKVIVLDQRVMELNF